MSAIWRKTTLGACLTSRRIIRPNRFTHTSTRCSEKVKPFTITRIYADDDGNTKFGEFKISMEGSGDIGYLSQLVKTTGVKFRLTPADYFYSWHRAPQRQFIVNLDGDVEVEVTSGEKKIIKQGEIFFVEDITGKGHFSRAVESQPRYSLFLPVTDDFKAEDC